MEMLAGFETMPPGNVIVKVVAVSVELASRDPATSTDPGDGIALMRTWAETLDSPNKDKILVRTNSVAIRRNPRQIVCERTASDFVRVEYSTLKCVFPFE